MFQGWIYTLFNGKIRYIPPSLTRLERLTFRGSSPPPPAGGFGGGRAGNYMYYVYTLYNRKHNKIYIGQTKDLGERLKLHKAKLFKKSFTAKLDGEWVLIYKEQVDDRKQALIKEEQLKSFRGREFIKQYIPR